jgi:hypothetical protein
MPDLKLARLPDRTPVKITVQIIPDLDHALRDYAAAYEAAYGRAETVADLIPPMLSAFLQNDRAFVPSPILPSKTASRRSGPRSLRKSAAACGRTSRTLGRAVIMVGIS